MTTLSLSADLLTPVAAFMKLRSLGQAPFLMESVTGGERFGRFSFLGLDLMARYSLKPPGKQKRIFPESQQRDHCGNC
ncbi:MAG: hypothetical protein IPP40_04105 [bacterium]|nr:hypothetical protein [bacterium]